MAVKLWGRKGVSRVFNLFIGCKGGEKGHEDCIICGAEGGMVTARSGSMVR